MDKLTNSQIIEALYKLYGEGNLQAALSFFDKDVIWERPGAPAIPFAGVFRNMEGLGKMFTILNATIKIKSFVPEKFCTNEDTVAVLGYDTAEVIATGRSYTSKWVQAFTFKDGKIIHVQVYMDTKSIAEAFLP